MLDETQKPEGNFCWWHRYRVENRKSHLQAQATCVGLIKCRTKVIRDIVEGSESIVLSLNNNLLTGPAYKG